MSFVPLVSENKSDMTLSKLSFSSWVFLRHASNFLALIFHLVSNMVKWMNGGIQGEVGEEIGKVKGKRKGNTRGELLWRVVGGTVFVTQIVCDMKPKFVSLSFPSNLLFPRFSRDVLWWVKGCNTPSKQKTREIVDPMQRRSFCRCRTTLCNAPD